MRLRDIRNDDEISYSSKIMEEFCNLEREFLAIAEKIVEIGDED